LCDEHNRQQRRKGSYRYEGQTRTQWLEAAAEQDLGSGPLLPTWHRVLTTA
jgi:hypothetical protein